MPVLAALQVVLLLAYPVLVFFGLSHLSPRAIGLLVIVLLLPGVVRTWREKPAELKSTLGVPAAIAALMVLAMIFDDPRFVLVYPALVNAALLLQFGLSLRSRPMIERFARLQVDDLSEREIAYCRAVTWFWCGFFVVNGGVCAGMALWAPRSWWALYTGLLSYLLLGLLMASEFTLRKYLFRRPAKNRLDRLFALVFPPESAPR